MSTQTILAQTHNFYFYLFKEETLCKNYTYVFCDGLQMTSHHSTLKYIKRKVYIVLYPSLRNLKTNIAKMYTIGYCGYCLEVSLNY